MDNNPNDPLGSALHAAAVTRLETRQRLVTASRKADGGHSARQVHREGQEALRHHRARAVRAARVVVVRETARLFHGEAPNTRTDPAVEYAQQQRVAAVVDGLEDDAAACAAMNLLLSAAHVGDNLSVAGGVAAAALTRGWDGALAAWVGSPALGGARGGWGTVERIRQAQRIVDGDLPDVLADLPPLEDMLASLRPRTGSPA